MAKNKFDAIAEQDARSVLEERLRISFKYLDWDSEEFFFHGMEIKYYQKFFDCISTIESSTEREITEQTHPSLSPKSIFNSQTSIRNSFSDEVITRIKDKLFVQTRDEESSLDQAREIASRAFEVRLGKNYGRIHGFIWNNTFNIVWFDPAHNLYPMNRGITKHKDVATVKCFSPDECLRLQEIIKELQKENTELYETLFNNVDSHQI
ncbi:hypothetical protein VB713_16260 [Anabaena cylindrica UHCC 0172]|uniref:hypothetical protein n=1 Tax=Anabaena cylindrica TaxID=1165 RepID=UPI002B1F6050|nr:hypothetical protein [Anabaena cylindrica]MEA5552496.1 hypothetical protein [Anabaena cylindrica UHCC 0172]